MTKDLFTEILEKIKEADREFAEITGKLPDSAFLGEYAQESVDRSINKTITLFSSIRGELLALNRYSPVLRNNMDKEKVDT